MLFDEGIDGSLVERGENLDVSFCILVSHIQPELVEDVGCGAVAVQPDVSLLRLAELLSVGLGDEGTSQCEGFVLVAQFAAYEFRTRGDVAPLVAASQLQAAVLFLVEMEEIIALEQLLGEFRE